MSSGFVKGSNIKIKELFLKLVNSSALAKYNSKFLLEPISFSNFFLPISKSFFETSKP